MASAHMWFKAELGELSAVDYSHTPRTDHGALCRSVDIDEDNTKENTKCRQDGERPSVHN